MDIAKSNFTKIDLIGQENAKHAQEEIDRIAGIIFNYSQYSELQSSDICPEILKIINNTKLSTQEQLEQSIPFLRLLRIDSLQKVQSAYQKPTASWKASNQADFKTEVENLSTVPPFLFFESLIEGVAKSKTKLESPNIISMSDADKKLHFAKIAQVTDLSSKLLNTYLDGVKEFLGQPKSSSELEEANFDNCLHSFQNDIGRAELEIDQVQHRKIGEMKIVNNEISSSNFELNECQADLIKTQDKDRKPVWRRFARFVTRGKFPKAVDTSQIETIIKTIQTTIANCEKTLATTVIHYNEIEAGKRNIIASLKNSSSVVESLKKQFLTQDNSVDVHMSEAKDFLTTIENDPTLQAQFIVKEKKVTEAVLQTQFVEEERKEEVAAAQNNLLPEAINSNLNKKFKIADLAQKGTAPADKLSQRGLKTLSKVVAVAGMFPPVAFAAMVIDAISKLNDKRVEKEFEIVAKFDENPNGKKILKKLETYLSKQYSELPIGEKSLDDFAASLTKKVIKAIATKAGGLDVNDDADIAVDKIINFLQKQQFVFNNKIIEVEPEFARDGTEYRAAGFITRQAIIVLDADGKTKELIPKSRQKTDEKIGDSKYGVRQATPSEQEEFSRNKKLTDYVEFIPKVDRLANALSETLDKVKLKDGITKEDALNEIKSIAEGCKDLKDKALSAKLKESLSEIIELGKRTVITHIPDEDRKNFNIIKNSLIKIIELGETKSGESKVEVAINSIQRSAAAPDVKEEAIIVAPNVEQEAVIADPYINLGEAVKGESSSDDVVNAEAISGKPPSDNVVNSAEDLKMASSSDGVNVDDIILTLNSSSKKKPALKNQNQQKIVNLLSSKIVTLIHLSSTKNKADDINDAADKIMKIVENIAAKVKGVKTPNFNDELKESLKKVVKLGTRGPFTNKADPDRKTFNEIKDVVSEMITTKVKEATAKAAHNSGSDRIQAILSEGSHADHAKTATQSKGATRTGH
ncbi:MAG: hypothetical protein EXR06_03435 [Rickettsiales bacterium]|nr:hypothetical protein [Rickettsiales bacterium]